ncbi:MAG: protoheme IX farnesyltransferase [Planctomycetes bacterium]|nr:protoheme IX farnesyltransferase [Planctomycetota bacterium]
MSTSVLTAERTGSAVWARLADYVEMTKPRIVVLELLVAGVAACLAMPRGLDAATVMHALFATALVAASASIANGWWERDSDARMQRTADRPLPAGRVSSAEALLLSAAMVLLGLVWLVWKVNLLTAALGTASWVLYVLVYTPLKKRTPLNTTIGAVAGAIPVLMGWTATGATLDLAAYALAGVLFLWQFPHFMAIAWLYRRDYAAGGHQMLSVVDPSGIRCGSMAVVGALVLIPVSLIPTILPTGGSPLVFLVWTFCLGTVQYALAVRFALHRDETSARLLLRGTLIYLPAWMAMLLMVTL